MEIRPKFSKLRNRLYLLKYSFFNLIKKTPGITQHQRNELLVVSLTTYPKRFSVVHLTIESLMSQTVKPDKIILWLAKEEVTARGLPEKILKLQNRGLEIKVVNENIRSYKKLVYSLKDFPQSYIITCDDDVIYPASFIDGIYKKSKAFPKSVIAYRCSEMLKADDKSLQPYVSWRIPSSNRPSFNLFPTGVGGVLYPPHSLDKRVTNKDLFMELSPLGDDIWFKAMALLNKTKTVMVQEESIDFPVIPNSQDSALWHVNVFESKNDEQLKNVFDYFKLYSFLD